MTDVVFSSFTESDLDDIFSYTVGFGVESVQTFIRRLMQKFNLLTENPNLGRSQNKLIFSLRNFPYKTYPIFYFPTESGIEIYRALRGARNIEDLFEDYFEGLKP